MNKYWIMIIAVCIMVGGVVSFAVAEGPTVEGKVITETTVNGNVDVKSGGQLDAGGITIEGDGTTIDSNSEINSKVDLGNTTVEEGSQVGIGGVNINESKLEGAKVKSTVTSTGTIKANEGTIGMGNISIDQSEVTGGAAIDSTVINTKEVEATGGGTVNMGNMNIKDSTISGQSTQVKSMVTNNGVVSADGQDSIIEMGGVDVIGGKVNDSIIDTTVTNDGEVKATGGGQIGMGKIGVYGGTISNGGLLKSTVKVNGGGRVTADGEGSRANLGGIRVGGQKN